MEFENAVAAYVGAKFGVATNACTSALHLSLRLSGVKSGDEVICPSFTCMATANAIHLAGATPIFADIDPLTEGLVLPGTLDVMGAVQLFGTQGSVTPAVAYGMAIGAIKLSNVPARIDTITSARVGLDVLAPLTPTFDVAARKLTLHAGTAWLAPGELVPLLLTFPGVKIAARAGEAPVTLASAAGRAALRGSR